MAKRNSLTRSESSASSASSASTLSCINVAARTTRESSVSEPASPTSTPPTSVPDDSIEDASSVKQEASVMTSGSVREDTADSTRRSSRPRSSIASYNLGSLSDLQHGKTGKAKGLRDFSGDTLVDDGLYTKTTDTPERREKLAGEFSKVLNMDWQIENLPAGGSDDASSQTQAKPSRRNSAVLDKVTHAADKLKSALGKRSREAVDTSKEMLGLGNKRASGRLQKLEQERAEEKTRTLESEDRGEDDNEAITAPANKKPKLVSRFSEDFTSTVSRPSSVASKTKKRYQVQGLFVGQALDSTSRPAEHKSQRKGKAGKSTAAGFTLIDTIKQRKHLPLPMFKTLEREKSFTIPYDVFAPIYRTRGDERPKDWNRLAKNRFIGDAKELWRRMKNFEPSVCVCKPPAAGELGCGEDCINRALEYECDESNCILGPELCTNRAFAELAERTKKGNEFDIGVEVLKTRDRGFGVRANRCFEPGQIIIEYSGEVITQDECERRMREEYKDKDVSVNNIYLVVCCLVYCLDKELT